MFGSFGDYAFVAHALDERCEFVAVDELGVSEDFGSLSEEFFDFFVVDFDLVDEFVGVGER